MDIVVVYEANPESLPAVLGLLRKEGFNPTTLENPSAAAALSGCGKASYLICVAVPSDEASGAKSALRKWDQAQRPKVTKIGRDAWVHFASSGHSFGCCGFTFRHLDCSLCLVGEHREIIAAGQEVAIEIDRRE
ncbi:MAG: hypothetical protein ACYS74_20360 [Planctomycetota bacterium]|jgi:hypothetical protein